MYIECICCMPWQMCSMLVAAVTGVPMILVSTLSLPQVLISVLVPSPYLMLNFLGTTTTISDAAILDSCPPAHRLTLQRELCTGKADAATGISSNRHSSNNTFWALWSIFYQELCQDSYLSTCPHPTPLLQVFANRYRMGIISPSGAKVQARTVEGALRTVGQTLATLGLPDPCLQPSGKLDLRLHCQLKGYSKIDPPPA